MDVNGLTEKMESTSVSLSPDEKFTIIKRNLQVEKICLVLQRYFSKGTKLQMYWFMKFLMLIHVPVIFAMTEISIA